MWHKQSFTQFWSQSDAYSRRSSLKLTYIHHPLVVCTHQICCAVAVPIALSQDRLLHGHNRLVNWTPCSRMRESKLKNHQGATSLAFVTGGFPLQRVNNTENVSIWWCHHVWNYIYIPQVAMTWKKSQTMRIPLKYPCFLALIALRCHVLITAMANIFR